MTLTPVDCSAVVEAGAGGLCRKGWTAAALLDSPRRLTAPLVRDGRHGRLREASSGTTVLVVAYRMATILLADEVVYIEGGRVIDHGSHEQLLGRCAGYERLVTAYAREAAEREAIAAGDEFGDEHERGADAAEEVSR